ncbi:AEC family transporter [Leptolyngbya sp. FACHB-36]|uniref:AEC family transporter n=1 Tax=Leptolyngbya sp. FACHB-36 TaxID=2692808 RepID=UPI001681BD94|nr:AEC family transporter [Leptolyngbya sp. FACHB-36]MBD2021344.1 AEC family transporter [Leptolyngbya sp. FACHB-36]
MPIANLLSVYAHLLVWTLLGWGLGRLLPKAAPVVLGKFLFYVGVPLSILGFLRGAELSLSLWSAPVVSWVAQLLGVGAASWVLRWQGAAWSRRAQGSFLLASMVGNTGYIGYPVVLALVGPAYFAWALLYDIGSTLGIYGFGVVLASRFSSQQWSGGHLRQALLKNPALWSFAIGLLSQNLPLPAPIEAGLRQLAWGVVSLALVLIGMRLSQLSSLSNVKPALISLGIKMLLVPLVLGLALKLLGITGPVHQVLLLQTAVPPAFGTLVIAEAYALDRELTVTTLALGSAGLFVTLPFWMWLFGN